MVSRQVMQSIHKKLPYGRLLVFLCCLHSPAYAQQVHRIQYSIGTGFFVSMDGYVLTNNHVVAPCGKYPSMVFSNGERMQAVLVARDTTHDLVLLKTVFAPADAALLRSPAIPLELGDALTVIGYPKISWENHEPVVRSARLLALEGPKGEASLMQFSDSVELGNSGGPLLDTAGNVIGVIMAKSTITHMNMRTHAVSSVRHADIAISLQTVVDFLRRNNVGFRVDNSIKRHSSSGIAERARRFVVNVRCRVNK